MPDMTKVQSSNIKQIGYDPETQDVHVHFHNGTAVIYRNVPEQVYEDFLGADSPGRFLNSNLKNVYTFEHV